MWDNVLEVKNHFMDIVSSCDPSRELLPSVGSYFIYAPIYIYKGKICKPICSFLSKFLRNYKVVKYIFLINLFFPQENFNLLVIQQNHKQTVALRIQQKERQYEWYRQSNTDAI